MPLFASAFFLGYISILAMSYLFLLYWFRNEIFSFIYVASISCFSNYQLTQLLFYLDNHRLIHLQAWIKNFCYILTFLIASIMPFNLTLFSLIIAFALFNGYLSQTCTYKPFDGWLLTMDPRASIHLSYLEFTATHAIFVTFR